MIANKKYNGLHVDVWSCGVILFAMVAGYLPFEDSNTSNLYKKILSGTYTLPNWLSDDLRDLIGNILCVDPDNRYNINQILNHKWCRSVGQVRVPQGLVVGFHRMPIDNSILAQLSGFGFDLDYAAKCIDANKHNHITTAYYLLLKKLLKEGGSSKADINSPDFDYEEVKPLKRKDSERDRLRSIDKEVYLCADYSLKARPPANSLEKSTHKSILNLREEDINLGFNRIGMPSAKTKL